MGCLKWQPQCSIMGKFYREVISNIMQGQWKLPMWDMTLGLGGNVLEVVSFQPIYVICSTLFIIIFQ